jgi:DNA (cytosine-5)-methyltransferase 1
VTPRRPTFYEFFAGGGMARAGLGDGWDCLFANDFHPQKADAYRENWGGADFKLGDVWQLSPADLPEPSAGGSVDLAWASSPCQDVSLAGKRGGLSGGRSSAFWGFHRLMQGLDAEGRAPRLIVIENVTGLLTSNGGEDFTALCAALAGLGYTFGALEVDAALFLPQSRPRLFVIAAKGLPARDVSRSGPASLFHSARVVEAFRRLPLELAACWRWWSPPAPAPANASLESLLEPDDAVPWFGAEQTLALIGALSPLHRRRLDLAAAKDGRAVAAVYRRMRVVEGVKVQRAELRLDGLAGCLRTPGGGSSRQFLIVADSEGVRARAVTPREAARLMGLSDDYRLPASDTAALQLAGDGVAVPVVRWLARTLLEPLAPGLGNRVAA